MAYNELYHHGVKGMKWGVRRYQNKDGTLTLKGKKRSERELGELNNDQRKSYTANPNKWVRDDLSRSRNLANEAAGMTRTLKTANKDLHENRPKKQTKPDLSSMSDQELRNRINRATLEKQYMDLCVPKRVDKGREAFDRTLSYAGTAFAIGGSALGIAKAIKELKG
mgnify:CR=1 FL=1